MPRPEPQDFRNYDTYKDAVSDWKTNDEEEEEHPWRYLFDSDERRLDSVE
jgi:hypothetical protein